MRHAFCGLAMLFLFPVGAACADTAPESAKPVPSRTKVDGGGLSFHVGLDQLHQITPHKGLRGDLELLPSGSTLLSSASFPGFPSQPAIEKPALQQDAYQPEAYQDIVNLYLDYRLPENPVSFYAGGGLGLLKRDASIDSSAGRTGRNTPELAYQLGFGGMYHHNDSVRFTLGARYLDKGAGDAAMLDQNANAALANEQQSVEVLAGVHVSFDKVAGLFSR